MRTSRRNLLAGIALGLPLAACGANPLTLDPKTINIVDAITGATKAFCGLLPTAETVAQMILALALPSGASAEQIAANVAHAFCDHVAPVVAQRAARGMGVRAREIQTGRTVINYGPIVINGKPVNVVVYAP